MERLIEKRVDTALKQFESVMTTIRYVHWENEVYSSRKNLSTFRAALLLVLSAWAWHWWRKWPAPCSKKYDDTINWDVTILRTLRIVLTSTFQYRAGDITKHPLDDHPLPFLAYGDVSLKLFEGEEIHHLEARVTIRNEKCHKYIYESSIISIGERDAPTTSYWRTCLRFPHPRTHF